MRNLSERLLELIKSVSNELKAGAVSASRALNIHKSCFISDMSAFADEPCLKLYC